MTSIDSAQVAIDLAHNWHPFMQMKDCETYPPRRIVKADGIRLFGETTWYYDSISSWWCNILGHGHPAIGAAFTQQWATCDHIMFGNFTHDPAIALSQKLVAITPPGLERVYYSDNGSTAVEVALKMAIQYWYNHNQPAKRRIICFDGAYHGDTIGAMSVSSQGPYTQRFESVMFTPIRIPYANEDDTLAALETVLTHHAHTTAAIIIEPLLMCAGGMRHTSVAFYQQVRALASAHQVLLISDEVATGFGRTGSLFASTAAAVTPDFMCLSKALTNGQFPLGVTMTTEAIYRAFYADYTQQKTFFHGHTFTANPLGCAIANATIAALEAFDWQNQVAQINTQLTHGFQQLANDIPICSHPRVIGTVAAIDVHHTDNRALFHMAQRGFDHHLTLRPLGNTVYLYLPLVTARDDCAHMLELLRQVLQSLIKPR
jgi:adenosylmethionine-8-amino-7-oxononanoate transaminase